MGKLPVLLSNDSLVLFRFIDKRFHDRRAVEPAFDESRVMDLEGVGSGSFFS
jgi:hypothetical protein